MLTTREKKRQTNDDMIIDQPAHIAAAHDQQPCTQALEMPDDVQASLDRIITYYKENALKPVMHLSGDPLDITHNLAKQMTQNLPDTMTVDAKIILNYLIAEIVDFCRIRQTKYLVLDFSFERESRGVTLESVV